MFATVIYLYIGTAHTHMDSAPHSGLQGASARRAVEAVRRMQDPDGPSVAYNRPMPDKPRAVSSVPQEIMASLSDILPAQYVEQQKRLASSKDVTLFTALVNLIGRCSRESLDSDLTVGVVEYFDAVNLLQDTPRYVCILRSVQMMLCAMGWTANGFSKAPDRRTLTSGLTFILDTFFA